MSRHRVLQAGPLMPYLEAALAEQFDCHPLWKEQDPRRFLAEQGANFQALVTTSKNGADAALMDAMPNLKAIAHFGVGYDTVDVDAAKARGIPVTNTPDVLTEEVADLAMALLLATIRRVPQGDRYVREGKWLKGPMALTESLQGIKNIA